MSTEEFLKALDYEQLKFARDCAESLIAAKNAESRVKLFVVSDDCMNYAAFTADHYSDAVERLCDEIRKAALASPGVELLFDLRPRMFRESEVEGMLEL